MRVASNHPARISSGQLLLSRTRWSRFSVSFTDSGCSAVAYAENMCPITDVWSKFSFALPPNIDDLAPWGWESEALVLFGRPRYVGSEENPAGRKRWSCTWAVGVDLSYVCHPLPYLLYSPHLRQPAGSRAANDVLASAERSDCRRGRAKWKGKGSRNLTSHNQNLIKTNVTQRRSCESEAAGIGSPYLVRCRTAGYSTYLPSGYLHWHSKSPEKLEAKRK